MSSLSILIVGFLLGMRHATEADHLAAVATLATRHSSLPSALRQGLAWGVGHTLTLMLIGGLVLALGKSLPAYMEPALECAVGIMLVVLGMDVLRRVVQGTSHFHFHSHGLSGAHVHTHSHAVAGPAASLATLASPQFAQMTFVQQTSLDEAHAHRAGIPFRALAIGMMHGMAGSAALIVLSLQSVQSVTMGLVYIALFGLGSMTGMALLSVAIAVPLRLSANYLTSLHKAMTAVVGLFSLALGIWAIARSGF